MLRYLMCGKVLSKSRKRDSRPLQLTPVPTYRNLRKRQYHPPQPQRRRQRCQTIPTQHPHRYLLTLRLVGGTQNAVDSHSCGRSRKGRRARKLVIFNHTLAPSLSIFGHFCFCTDALDEFMMYLLFHYATMQIAEALRHVLRSVLPRIELK